MKKKSVIIRTDPQFKKILREIKLENMKKGKNFSDRRITLAITRIPNLKEFILMRGIKEDE